MREQTSGLAQYQGGIEAITDSFVALKDICCVGSDGGVFERYPTLFLLRQPYTLDLAKRISAGQVIEQVMKSPNGHLYKNPQYFIPSAALYCTILDLLFQQADNDDVRGVLEGFSQMDPGVTNTRIDYHPGKDKITHYPEQGQSAQRKAINLATSGLNDIFKNRAPTDDFRANLTGLSWGKAQSVNLSFQTFFTTEIQFFGLFSTIPYIYVSTTDCCLIVNPVSPKSRYKSLRPEANAYLHDFLVVSETKPNK